MGSCQTTIPFHRGEDLGKGLHGAIQWASTTATYTSVGADAKSRMLRDALSRAPTEDGGGEADGRLPLASAASDG